MGVQEDLIDAINWRSLMRVHRALKAGANPSVPCIPVWQTLTTRKSPLELAVEHPENAQIIRVLVDTGATEAVLVAAKSIVLGKLQKANNIMPRISGANQSKEPGGINDLQTKLGILEEALHWRRQAKTPEGAIPKQTDDGWKKLLFSEKFSDVQFIFPEEGGAILHAHKCVLAASSPYFDYCLGGPWREVHPDGRWETNNSLSVMKAILSFMYTGDVTAMEAVLDDNQARLDDMLSLVVQYELPILKDLVATHMTKRLSLDTVKGYLCTSHLHGLSNLKKASIEFVRNNWEDAMFGEHSVALLAHEDPDLWKEMGVAVRGNKRQKTG